MTSADRDRPFSQNSLVCAQFILVMFAVPIHALGATLSSPIAEEGKSQAAIIVGENPGELSRLAARELQKYLRTLSGAEIPIVRDAQISSLPARQTLILVGDPRSNHAVRQAAQANRVSFEGLKPEGFVIKTGRLKDHPVVVVG